VQPPPPPLLLPPPLPPPLLVLLLLLLVLLVPPPSRLVARQGAPAAGRQSVCVCVGGGSAWKPTSWTKVEMSESEIVRRA
jgi:hypothetical protein